MPSAAALDAAAITLHHAGRGPPLVLLHCLGVDRHFWNFCADLARDFTLLRYDLPGHGETAVPAAAYSIEDLSAQLAEVLAANRIARAHVAGISLGGLIAQHFAATRPELVDRLILIDTTPRYSDELRRMWDERAATARAAGVAPMVAALLAIWFSADALGRDDAGVRDARALPGRGLCARLRGVARGRPARARAKNRGAHARRVRRRRHPDLPRGGALARRRDPAGRARLARGRQARLGAGAARRGAAADADVLAGAIAPRE